MGKLTRVIRPESSVPAVNGLLASAGASSEEELQKLVEQRKALDGYGLADVGRDGIECLKLVLSEDSEARARIKAALGFGR